MKSIPEKWIQKYVDQLLELAKAFGPDSPMGISATQRADHILDMVKAYRASTKKSD